MDDNRPSQSVDYRRIEKAIQFLEANYRRQPSLDEVAASVHLSKYHFQRLFKRWAGISPTQFMHYLTVNYAKQQLEVSRSVYGASLEAGVSGASRLHDLFVTFEGVTPGEYKQQGQGVIITYGFHPSPFGKCLLAKTPRGICALRFADLGGSERLLVELKGEWPQATFVEDFEQTRPVVERIFSYSDNAKNEKPFHLYLKGTNFQFQVWQALLAIPQGTVASYEDIAADIGRPTAARAVASAIARNPVGYLIPCHRVISKSGQFHRYRWGRVRKKAILVWEAGQTSS